MLKDVLYLYCRWFSQSIRDTITAYSALVGNSSFVQIQSSEELDCLLNKIYWKRTDFHEEYLSDMWRLAGMWIYFFYRSYFFFSNHSYCKTVLSNANSCFYFKPLELTMLFTYLIKYHEKLFRVCFQFFLFHIFLFPALIHFTQT